jgi:hypothetical protein
MTFYFLLWQGTYQPVDLSAVFKDKHGGDAL